MTAEQLIEIRQSGGAWVAYIRGTSQFVIGWHDIVALRTRSGLREQFLTEEYPAFLAEFGPPPESQV